MPSLRDFFKGRELYFVTPQVSVSEAARYMSERNVGAVCVLEKDRLVGIVSERDMMKRVIAANRDPRATLVADVMTLEVLCCTPETGLEEVRGVMKHRRIRHLPVVDGARCLQGLVSIGDLNAHEATSQEQTIHLLHEYLYGRV